MPDDPFDIIASLRAQGRPFAVATVLRTADATSAKAGAKAMVTEDGSVLGHVGGACVTGALRQAAAQAMATGEPRLIRVRPRGADDATVADVSVYESGCPSRGTVDLLIEPWRLPPLVAVIGGTPIAAAVLAHARLAGLRAEAATPGELAALAPGAGDTVVIATQGAGDMAALRAALASDAGRVPMIASRRKAQTLTQRLAAEGMAPERLARLQAPAGLDIGAVDPHEIAVSVLAAIMAHRRRGARAAGVPGAMPGAMPHAV
ncbi:MAG: XdhC family protein [Pseudomonadota bacterium]